MINFLLNHINLIIIHAIIISIWILLYDPIFSYLNEKFRIRYSPIDKFVVSYIIIISFLCTMVIARTYDIYCMPDTPDTSVTIEKISQDLANSSKELSNIQSELEERIKFVENLKEEAEIAEGLLSLSDEQIDAIQAKLNQELNSSGNKTLAQSILISGTFFILGIITPYTITFFKRKVTEHNEPDGENILLDKYSNEEIEQAIRLLDA